MLLRNLLMPKLKRLELNLEELKIYHSSYSDYVNSVLDYLTYPQGFRTDPVFGLIRIRVSFLVSGIGIKKDVSFVIHLFVLDYQDSNLDKQNQKLLCYHYTIVQTFVLSFEKRCKDKVIY